MSEIEMENKSSKMKTGLGKGLGALIPNVPLTVPPADRIGKENEAANFDQFIAIEKIDLNPYQPRKEFDPEALEDLTASIKTHGVIQPVTVRRKGERYELISGERRLRASSNAGLTLIPAYVMASVTDTQMLEIAIIENIQRQDFNPIEIASGYQRLIDECNLTQEQVAERVGKNRSTVTNFLRLLRLPEKIQDSLRDKEITPGHARAVLSMEGSEGMIALWREITEKELSVRQAEELAKSLAGKPAKKQRPGIAKAYEPNAVYYEELMQKIREKYGTDAIIRKKNESKGSIEIEFYSDEDLNRILELMELL